MRFRTGLVIGIGIGYYYGARAGRARYEQIEQVLDRIRSTPAYRDAQERLEQTVGEQAGRARERLEEAVPALRDVFEPGELRVEESTGSTWDYTDEPVGDPTAAR